MIAGSAKWWTFGNEELYQMGGEWPFMLEIRSNSHAVADLHECGACGAEVSQCGMASMGVQC
jgi:hypothetical protein